MADSPTNAMAADADLQKVWMWDCGPEKPHAPERPKLPKGEDGDPDHDLAMIDFREQMTDYETALKTYRAAKAEYSEFEKRQGGPIEHLMWSCDASDALKNDEKAIEDGRQEKRRWYISSRTRGYSGLRNQGLPNGMRPGHGHEENLRRQAEGETDLALAKRRDPVFGEQEIRQ
jgi:hypothetical protein